MAPNENPSTVDREIVVSRLIHAQRRFVFQAFTEAHHLAQWFGPHGFSLTTKTFEFRPGGEWIFTMHGPDGTDYPNWVCWQEILPPERLVYRQGKAPDDPDAFVSILTLEDQGSQTQITLHTVLNSKEQRDELIKSYGALEGAHRTLERLAVYSTTFSTGAF